MGDAYILKKVISELCALNLKFSSTELWMSTCIRSRPNRNFRTSTAPFEVRRVINSRSTSPTKVMSREPAYSHTLIRNKIDRQEVQTQRVRQVDGQIA